MTKELQVGETDGMKCPKPRERHLAIAVVGQRLQGQIALVLEIWFRRHLLLLLASDVAGGMRLHPVR